MVEFGFATRIKLDSNCCKGYNYYGLDFIIPNGYQAQEEEGKLIFVSSNKAFILSLYRGSYEETINELETEMNSKMKNTTVNGVTFSTADYLYNNEHMLMFVLKTAQDNLVLLGSAFNSDFTYDETILKDVLVALGLSDNASEFSVPSTFSGNSNIMDEINIENFNKNLDVFE